MKTVLFYQHFGLKGIVRGAHHKTFDFFNHIKSFDNYKPVIYFDESSIWDEGLPWFECFDTMPTIKDLQTEPDILFLNSGKDWIKYTQHKDVGSQTPIVSPVNNFRATKPGHKSFDFLDQKAIRLCPSPEIYDSVRNHPHTRGETVYMPNGVGICDTALNSKSKKPTDILIVGNKNPKMAMELYQKINHLNKSIEVVDGWISKEDFQIKLAQSKISIHLPKKIEEHYIPGLEAMMLKSFVIIPDCIGNRSYSKDKKTCYLSTYNLSSFITTLHQVLSIPNLEFKRILTNAEKLTKQYSMEIERKTLYNVLESTNKIWNL